jgi:predicted dehydrogenase
MVGMQRRTLLLSALAAAQPGRIRIGFLGSTHPHGPEKLRQMQHSSEWELAGLAEKDPTAAAAAKARGIHLVSRRALLDDPAVRAIAVEGDVGDHAADAIEALEAGKHVHLEKAPAADMASFRKTVELAGRKGLVLQMGYMWRYNPAINAALDAARSGALGDVYLIRGSINTLNTPEAQAWIARFPGGQMFEMAGHLIDPMVRLMGRPAKVTPFLQVTGASSGRAPDNTVAVFEWPRALGVLLTAGMQSGSGAHRTFEILGTKGTAVVRPIEPPTLALETAAGRQNASMPPYKRYIDDFRDFAAAIRDGRKLRYSAEEDLAVEETLLRASGMDR